MTKNELRNCGFLLVFVVLSALLEVVGVASILPLIAVIADPEIIEKNTSLTQLQAFVGVEEVSSFIKILSYGAFGAIFLALSVRAFTVYYQANVLYKINYSLGHRLVEGYLQKPYGWFANQNSSELAKTVLTEVEQVVNSSIFAVMQILAFGTSLIAILIFLLALFPEVTLVSIAVFGAIYMFIYAGVSGFAREIGHRRVKANKDRFLAVSQVFSGIKDVKISGEGLFFLSKFAHPSREFARLYAISSVIRQMPRFAIEIVSFGILIVTIATMLDSRDKLVENLPIISVFALAGLRILPAAQQIYASFTTIQLSQAALDRLFKGFQDIDSKANVLYSGCIPYVFDQTIEMQGVWFKHENGEEFTLRDATVQLKRGELVAVVGVSGSGKTTFVDILLGLLQPTRGALLIDGKVQSPEAMGNFLSTVGYVPQTVQINDDTIESNIAFGVATENIDKEWMQEVCRMTGMHDFIETKLSAGYQTYVGERGARLSGGQRQRIGIARALYRRPTVLVLDEATAALESSLEDQIFKNICTITDDINIIFITHNIQSTKLCDQIILLDDGCVEAIGKYDTLMEKSDKFRKIAAPSQNPSLKKIS